ncbi:hypothetical protein [Peribacillus sp. NPDC096448]|uniref:hypothetical protein n=1 Tax=Peribacillus sp. NPDC096448 TaxID=3364395 RepID=UPI0037FC3B3F
MAAKKETAKDRLYKFVEIYGVEVINKIIERHNLATEKRTWFTIRFAEKDPMIEKECTETMEKLDEKIYKIDRELGDCYDINDKLRTQIIRDIKKARPDDWMMGFDLQG